MKKYVAALCFLSAFGLFAQGQPKYKKISAAEAQKMIDSGSLTVLDVRTPEEFAEGHIADALLLPDYDINTGAAKLLPDKNATILVYCRSGHRSAGAAKALVALGYTNVYDFGGIIGWHGQVVKKI